MAIISQNSVDPYNFYLGDEIFRPHGINRFTIYWKEDNQGKLAPADYLRKMHDVSINSLRLTIPGYFMEWQEGGIEPKLGQYNAKLLEPVKETFELAASLGIYIVLCLFDYAAFCPPWDKNIWTKQVYSTKFHHPKDFFGSPELRKYEKGRLDFLIDCFKEYDNLFAWEPMNEMNYMGKMYGTDCKKMTMEWFDDMSEHIRKQEPAHMITASLWGGEMWDSLYENPRNDIVQIHTYDTKDAKEIAGNIQMYIRRGRQFNKPVFVGEFGTPATKPDRLDFVVNGLKAAQSLDSSAWLWAATWDEFGDLDDQLFAAYERTAPDHITMDSTSEE